MELTIKNSLGKEVVFTNQLPITINLFQDEGIDVIATSNKGIEQDGETYLNSSLDKRQLTLNYTISADTLEELSKLKQEIYNVLNPKLGQCEIILDTGLEKYRIVGTVEKIPEYDFIADFVEQSTIRFICYSPFWKDVSSSRIDIASWQGSFEFPLEISENEGVEFGYRNEELLMNIQNNGDVTCGMTVEFRALGTVVNPSILNVVTREFIKINKTMSPGEIIRVNTNFGNKRVEQEINTELKNISQFINLDSTYMQLDVGDNYIKYNADSNVDNLEVTISYSQQYLGV